MCRAAAAILGSRRSDMPQTHPTTPESTAAGQPQYTLASPASPLLGGADAIGGVGPVAGVSVKDFLTDGSLVAVCDELCRTTGLPIWVRDAGGDAIVPGIDGTVWHSVPDAQAAARAAKLAGLSDEVADEFFTAPLRTSAGVLGWLVLGSPDRAEAPEGVPSGPPAYVQSVQNALARLATAISEGCEAQLSLRQRVMELGALYRLSSMVVETEDTDRLLSAALELAIEVLRADAGSIGLIEEGHDRLVIKATRGLSAEWVNYSSALSHGGLLRQAAMRGEIVCVEDLATDEANVDPQRVRAEGLCSLLSTGLMYHGRAIGLIRLYTRRPRWFTLAERGLIRSIADQSAAAVLNARLKQVREENERVRRQMRLAADVQRRMLPRSMPETPALDVAARYVPSFELGGDFYDFIKLGPNLGGVIGDVVGKGVAAALLMSAVRASLRAHAQDVYDLDEVLFRVNAALANDTRDDEFATLWYGVFDPRTHDLTYCNAGHNPPLLFRSREHGGHGGVEELDVGGMALGIDAQQRYQRGVVHLGPGDVIVAYTDGITDAVNFAGKRFGKAALRSAVADLLIKEPGASAARIVEQVFWHVRQFAGLNTAPDDMTLVVVRVRA